MSRQLAQAQYQIQQLQQQRSDLCATIISQQSDIAAIAAERSQAVTALEDAQCQVSAEQQAAGLRFTSFCNPLYEVWCRS